MDFCYVLPLHRNSHSILQVSPFEKKHGLWPCMVAPTKIIAGLGLSLDIDILEAPGATGDYRTLLTSKVTAIAKALTAPLQSCPCVFVPGEEKHKPGRSDGYDFGFLHIKVLSSMILFFFCLFRCNLNSSVSSQNTTRAQLVFEVLNFRICGSHGL